MGKRFIDNVLVVDFLAPDVNAVYDRDDNQAAIVLTNLEKPEVETRIYGDRVVIPLLDCNYGDWSPARYFKEPPDNFKTSLEKLFLATYEFNKNNQLITDSFTSAHKKAQAILAARTETTDIGCIFGNTKTDLPEGYDFERRYITLPGLPENTLMFVPDREFLGVMAVKRKDPIPPFHGEKFGAGILCPENAVIINCETSFEN